MTDANLLALLFYSAAAFWGIGGVIRFCRFDLTASIAMLMACVVCLEGGWRRWGTEPRTVVIEKRAEPPISIR